MPPPKSAPVPSAVAIPSASRRAKRIIESESPSPSDHLDEDELEHEEDELDGDGDGEEYESEEGPTNYSRSRGRSLLFPPDNAVELIGIDDAPVSSAIASEDMDLDLDHDASADGKYEPEAEPTPEPSLALRIRLKVNDLGSGRPSRAAAKRSGKRTKMVAREAEMGSDEESAFFDISTHVKPLPEEAEADEIDELDLISQPGSSRRSTSPSKLTARQRAKGNKDLQDTLIALPNEGQGKKLILTEAERLQRREETARRRKRQSEQRLQDEQVGLFSYLTRLPVSGNGKAKLMGLQDQTINRLLRAQTGRSRAKLDGPSPIPASNADPTEPVQATVRRPATTAPREGMIRWISSLVGENVDLRVAVPLGREGWLDVGGAGKVERRDVSGFCAVEGCKERRKYRCVKKFEVGGCCLTHLQVVEAGSAGT